LNPDNSERVCRDGWTYTAAAAEVGWSPSHVLSELNAALVSLRTSVGSRCMGDLGATVGYDGTA
jgi:hypothetical protein